MLTPDLNHTLIHAPCIIDIIWANKERGERHGSLPLHVTPMAICDEKSEKRVNFQQNHYINAYYIINMRQGLGILNPEADLPQTTLKELPIQPPLHKRRERENMSV